MPFLSRFSSLAWPLLLVCFLLQGTFWTLKWLQRGDGVVLQPKNEGVMMSAMPWVDQWFPLSSAIKPVAPAEANRLRSTIRTQDGQQGVAILSWGGEIRTVGVGAFLDEDWRVVRIHADSVDLRHRTGAEKTIGK